MEAWPVLAGGVGPRKPHSRAKCVPRCGFSGPQVSSARRPKRPQRSKALAGARPWLARERDHAASRYAARVLRDGCGGHGDASPKEAFLPARRSRDSDPGRRERGSESHGAAEHGVPVPAREQRVDRLDSSGAGFVAFMQGGSRRMDEGRPRRDPTGDRRFSRKAAVDVAAPKRCSSSSKATAVRRRAGVATPASKRCPPPPAVGVRRVRGGSRGEPSYAPAWHFSRGARCTSSVPSLLPPSQRSDQRELEHTRWRWPNERHQPSGSFGIAPRCRC